MAKQTDKLDELQELKDHYSFIDDDQVTMVQMPEIIFINKINAAITQEREWADKLKSDLWDIIVYTDMDDSTYNVIVEKWNKTITEYNKTQKLIK